MENAYSALTDRYQNNLLKKPQEKEHALPRSTKDFSPVTGTLRGNSTRHKFVSELPGNQCKEGFSKRGQPLY